LVSEDAQLKCTEQIGHLPALKTVYDDPLIKDDPMKKILVEQIKYGKSYPSIAEWGTIEAVLSEQMGEIWDIVIENYDENKIENKVKEISKSVNKVLE
jgi:multiple sugar transport system substrate-binding protein